MSVFLRSYSIVLIETACNIIFFEIFVRDGRKGRHPFFAKWMLIMVMGLFSCGNAFFLDEHILAKQILDIVCTMLALSIYFREKVGKCFALSVVYTGILWLADFITILICPSVVQENRGISETGEFLVVILAKLLLFLLIVFMSKAFRYNMMRYMKEKDWLIFLVIPVISMAIILAFIKNVRVAAGTELEKFFVVSAWGLACINILMFYWMQNMGAQEYLLREKALLEAETRNQLQLYQAIAEKVRQQRKVSHEYENQFTCIQALCGAKKYNELEKYLEEIRGKAMQDINYIDTGNIIVNAVLNAKYQEAAEKGILVVWRVNDLSKVTTASSDLVVLLSNLLGNAVEACEKCGQERCIQVKCFYEEDELVLSVRNAYNGKLNLLHGELYTTKSAERESHGIGLKNVKQVIEKNHGYYTLGHTDTEFWVSVIIPQGAR